MVINDSRMLMRYGGDDIVETFMHLLETVEFPYKDCNLAREWDWELVQWLMEQCCSANEVCQTPDRWTDTEQASTAQLWCQFIRIFRSWTRKENDEIHNEAA